jgi:trans-aconitate methyltransferase
MQPLVLACKLNIIVNTWTGETYRRNAAYVPALGGAVFELLSPRRGERILDLGCGEGTLTERIVTSGAIVVGVDTSPDMIAGAAARGLDARIINAEQLPFDGEFDAVFSNAVLHWVGDHDAMLAGVQRALKPGGRFVAEFGGHGNIAAIETAIRAVLAQHGWKTMIQRYYPTDDEYKSRLEQHGFAVTQMSLIPRPTPLPTGIRGWLETFDRATIEQIPPPDRETFLHEVEQLLRPAICDNQGRWTAHYIRLRFSAEAANAEP